MEYLLDLDPLVGTKEFIQKNDEFTVNIALVSDGSPVLVVIYLPVQKILYYTDEIALYAFKVILSDKNESLDYIFENALEITPYYLNSQLPSVIKIFSIEVTFKCRNQKFYFRNRKR